VTACQSIGVFLCEQFDAASPTVATDISSRAASTAETTSDYATASRRTSVCTSNTSGSDCHSAASTPVHVRPHNNTFLRLVSIRVCLCFILYL